MSKAGRARASLTRAMRGLAVSAVREEAPADPAEDAGAPGETVGVPLVSWALMPRLLESSSCVQAAEPQPEFVRHAPRYQPGLRYDALSLVAEDLVQMREVLRQMESLHAEYRRDWSGDWWASTNLQALKTDWKRQRVEFRTAVSMGLVTRRQHLRLLRRVGKL